MTQHTPSSLTPSPALLRAVRQLLRPLVRLLMRWGVPFPQLSDLLKEVYVEVADRDFAIENKPNSDSRVTLLTGVHRKDVRRLRSHVEANVPAAVSMGARLVAMWLADSAYVEDGAPREIPRQGECPSFEHLVESVSKGDLRARVMLDELERQGVVSIDGDLVRLMVEAFIPTKSLDEKVFFFGKNLHDHISAAEHNLQNGEPPMFDRSVYYNNLNQASIEEVSQLVNEQASALLKMVNVIAREKQRQDHDVDEEKHRFNLGVFYWVEPQPADAEQKHE